MRGKDFSSPSFLDSKRITPAYAGKSGTALTDAEAGGDHPRVCEEKERRVRSWRALLGSPPRMRGKVVGGRTGCIEAGITPAYAGKRS